MYSPETGAFFRFKSEKDISLFSTGFVPIRIAIVIKEKSSEKFVEKLWLMTSKTQLMVAAPVEKQFDRNSNANNRYSTLILATSADDNLEFIVNVFPKDKPARNYVLRYDQMTKKFHIPDGLKIGFTSNQTDPYCDGAAQIHAQLDDQSNMGAQSHQLANVYNFGPRNRLSNIATQNLLAENAYCGVCFGAHHSSECRQGKLSNCFECHVPARHIGDHSLVCSVKHWFVSERVDKYVKIPSTRCLISFESPIHILLNGDFCIPPEGLGLLSSMCDTYYKFERYSNSNDKKTNKWYQKVSLMSTGYTRIRLPIIVQENPNQFTERIILMTSHDRAIIAAEGSRQIHDKSVPSEYEHNTPLVLSMLGKPSNILVEVRSAGRRVHTHEIAYVHVEKKFRIPPELNVKSKDFKTMTFDAVLPSKIKRQ